MPGPSPKRILIVEDDPDFVAILSRLLRAWSVDIVIADSSTDATHVLGTTRFDLVLLDIKLRDEDDGFGLLSFLSIQPPDVKASCVIVTGFPVVGRAWSELPVVDKRRLGELGPHLFRILGPPPAATEAETRP